jgi:hypothetical protein
MSPSSSAISALPWLAVTWIITVVVVTGAICLITREVLRKTDPQNLPEVLRALTPLLNVIARALARLPIGSSADKELPSGQTGNTPDAQTGNTSVEQGGEAS